MRQKNQTEQKRHSGSRRRFIATGIASAALMCSEGLYSFSDDIVNIPGYPKEARFYKKVSGKTVQCGVCPRMCTIENGERGYCRTRENRSGVLYSLVYGKVAAKMLDPVEKKPFFHVLPGASAYSISTAGCNFKCKFCQNSELSQSKTEDLRTTEMWPSVVVSSAVKAGADLIAYTYNEPTVYTEFVYDCASAANKKGIGSIVVSNGFINEEPLKKLCEVIRAYKVDLKSFSGAFYKDITGGEISPVLATLKNLKKAGVWTEIVNLVIPTLNDDENNFKKMAEWIYNEIGPDVPVHFTRFYPRYLLTSLPVTPISTLETARDIFLKQGMRFVYIGNVPGHPAESTYCPSCEKRIIERGKGYSVGNIDIKNGKCKFCGAVIPGIWSL